jgi:hypothetical protein
MVMQPRWALCRWTGSKANFMIAFISVGLMRMSSMPIRFNPFSVRSQFLPDETEGRALVEFIAQHVDDFLHTLEWKGGKQYPLEIDQQDVLLLAYRVLGLTAEAAPDRADSLYRWRLYTGCDDTRPIAVVRSTNANDAGRIAGALTGTANLSIREPTPNEAACWIETRADFIVDDTMRAKWQRTPAGPDRAVAFPTKPKKEKTK